MVMLSDAAKKSANKNVFISTMDLFKAVNINPLSFSVQTNFD